MKRQLELKDICGYLPYGLVLKAKESKKLINCFGVNLHYYQSIIGMFQNEYSTYSYNLCDFEPILNPLTNLYKTITHNGKEIIPIVELAKIAEPNCVWKINKEMAIRDIIHKTWKDKIYFGYNGLHRKPMDKRHRYFYSLYQDDNVEYIPDQIPLFDYLHELKIDYRGLIESGLAIDANTLETNPYK
jgi:hypothetical protein